MKKYLDLIYTFGIKAAEAGIDIPSDLMGEIDAILKSETSMTISDFDDDKCRELMFAYIEVCFIDNICKQIAEYKKR